MTDAVRFEDVTRTYRGGVRGVAGLHLAVAEGTTLGLVGRNGAGKTTAIRLAVGMLRPDSGTVRVFGRDPSAEPVAVRRGIGFVAEDHELPPALTAADVFALHRDLFPEWDGGFERELVERLELPTNRKLSTLSKGQRRQAALVAAVAHRPKLLLLDEPGGGLDPVVRREFLETVIRLVSEAGTTVVLSSHALPEVERIADRIAVIHEGRVLVENETDRLREGACRVLVDGDGAPATGEIPGCVRAERRDGAVALTFLLSEEAAREAIRAHGGLTVRQAAPLSFEDLFVDLVGGKA
jgi:ABC-2 type transport system ATP-binding protein